MTTQTPPETRPLLHLVRDLREGKLTAANLAVEDRRAVVEYYSMQGLSVPEMAVLIGVSDSTVKRDRAEIRRANALRPGRELADEFLPELVAQANCAIERLRRTVRDNGEHPPTPHQRMRAEINCFRIYRDLVRLLHNMRYIPSGSADINDEIDKILGRAATRSGGDI